MRYMMLAGLLAVATVAGAQETDIEAQRQEALIRFKKFTAEAARGLQLEGKVGIATTDEVLNGDPEMPTSIGLVPEDDPRREKVAFILSIRNVFLDDYPPGGLQHAATHEICHAVLGQLNRTHEESGDEFQVEKCVYLYLGEDFYIAFLRADAARSDENRHYAEMDELEFRNLIRRWFGYEEIPLP